MTGIAAWFRERENSWLRTFAIGFILVGGGLILLAFERKVEGEGYAKIVHEFASILIAVGVVSVAFELWQKEAFFRELFYKGRAVEQLHASGLTGFAKSFQNDAINWGELFSKSTQLDVFFSYAATWRNTHYERIDTMLRQTGSRLRAVLPDPESTVAMAEMAARYNITVDELRNRINAAVDFFRERSTRFPGKVEIYLFPRSMSHSFYRFNNHVVLALYNHAQGRVPVPTFVAERGGELYDFLHAEVQAFVGDGTNGSARRV